MDSFVNNLLSTQVVRENLEIQKCFILVVHTTINNQSQDPIVVKMAAFSFVS